jgi:ABC-type oligopeptide transport system substrate-binding subunit
MTRKAFGLVSALALASALGLSACSTTTGSAALAPPAVAPAPGPDAVDSHTYARPEIARVVDVALDLSFGMELVAQ